MPLAADPVYYASCSTGTLLDQRAVFTDVVDAAANDGERAWALEHVELIGAELAGRGIVFFPTLVPATYAAPVL